jgi:hypothetical protein
MNEGNGGQSETQNNPAIETPKPEVGGPATPTEMAGATAEQSPARPEREESGVIRGAYLARRAAEASASAGSSGQSESDTSVVTLRAAYVAHLSEPPMEAVGGVAVVASGNILRGVYVARAVTVPQPATRKSKAAPPRKKATKKAARKSAARRGSSTAKKGARRAASAKPRKKASARAKTTAGAKTRRVAGSKRAKSGRAGKKSRR